jgi:hypothetical protein
VYAVQQIRLFRRSGAARRALHLAAERRQREDIRVPLVLVRDPRRPHLRHSPVPARDHLLSPHASVHDAHAVQARQAGQRRHHSAQKQNGRLVPPLHSRGELGLRDFPGHNERVRKQTEPQLSASHSRRAGRVTSDTRVGVPHVTDVVAA